VSDQPADRTLDRTLRVVLAAIALFGAAFSLAAVLVYGVQIAAGVLLGAVIAVVNFWALARLVPLLFRQRRAGAWAVVEALKMVGLVVLVWLIIRSGWIDALALAAGYGALPLGITVGSLFAPPDDPPAGAGDSSPSAPNVVDDGPDAS
jgi:hypothetical protein